jgi:riboflavin biosynthesis pyrimidine reductase
VVLDANLSIPEESKLVRTAHQFPTIVLCSHGADQNRVKRLRSLGTEVAPVQDDSRGNLDVNEILHVLSGKGLKSILIEGGSRVITSFLRAGRVDRLVVITAPIVIGEGIPCIGDLGIRELSEARRFARVRVRRIGRDLVWELRCNG